jgi:hypothetical protein
VSYFSPRDFLMLLDAEQRWLELLFRMFRGRQSEPDKHFDDAIILLLRDRARQLRN